MGSIIAAFLGSLAISSACPVGGCINLDQVGYSDTSLQDTKEPAPCIAIRDGLTMTCEDVVQYDADRLSKQK